ncbi:MAG TPA: SGNH hydrolase domain-containing protein [Acidimicrobiales bacterium]|nr:SGNH hydrolase domain-containing protein [Acidimicrobiales bacterium]
MSVDVSFGQVLEAWAPSPAGRARTLGGPKMLVTAILAVLICGLVAAALGPEAPAAATRGADQAATAVSPLAAGLGRRLPRAPVVSTPLPPPVVHHFNRPGDLVRVMFVGDSVAQTTAAGLGPLASRYGGAIANEGIMGCGVTTASPYRYFGSVSDLLPQCYGWASTWMSAVQRDDPDVVAIVVGRWELMDRVFQGHWTHIGDPAYDAYLETQIDLGVSIAASKGAKVALLTDPYYLRGHTPTGGIFPEDDPARVDLVNGLLHQVAARYPGLVTVVDFGAFLSPGGHFSMVVDGTQVRSDGVHMTPDAGAVLAPWIMPQLVAIGRSA